MACTNIPSENLRSLAPTVDHPLGPVRDGEDRVEGHTPQLTAFLARRPDGAAARRSPQGRRWLGGRGGRAAHVVGAVERARHRRTVLAAGRAGQAARRQAQTLSQQRQLACGDEHRSGQVRARPARRAEGLEPQCGADVELTAMQSCPRRAGVGGEIPLADEADHHRRPVNQQGGGGVGGDLERFRVGGHQHDVPAVQGNLRQAEPRPPRRRRSAPADGDCDLHWRPTCALCRSTPPRPTAPTSRSSAPRRKGARPPSGPGDHGVPAGPPLAWLSIVTPSSHRQADLGPRFAGSRVERLADGPVGAHRRPVEVAAGGAGHVGGKPVVASTESRRPRSADHLPWLDGRGTNTGEWVLEPSCAR